MILRRWYRDQSYCIEIAAINYSEKYLALPWTRDLNAVEDVRVVFFSTRTHIPGKAIRALAEERPGCLILCITDTHIQNLYQEWVLSLWWWMSQGEPVLGKVLSPRSRLQLWRAGIG